MKRTELVEECWCRDISYGQYLDMCKEHGVEEYSRKVFNMFKAALDEDMDENLVDKPSQAAIKEMRTLLIDIYESTGPGAPEGMHRECMADIGKYVREQISLDFYNELTGGPAVTSQGF